MTSHRIIFASEPDEFEADGTTEVNWLEPTRAVDLFPMRSTFTLNSIAWYIELNVLPGRFGDRLHVYLLKFEDNIYTPMLDFCIHNGVQININDELRLYAYDIEPFFDDLYRLSKNKELQGSYNLAVAAYS